MLKTIIIAVFLIVFGSSLASLAQGGFLPAVGAAEDEDVPVDVEFVNPITSNTLDEVINGLVDFVFTIALVVCPIVIIIGGFIFVTASGDPKKVETGKKIIFWALVGLGIAIMAKGFVELVRYLLGVKKT